MNRLGEWTFDPIPDEDREVSADAMELLTLATFNGLCHIITALGDHGILNAARLEGLHDAMAPPLDDESCRDDDFLVSVRETLEEVLANAMKVARSGLRIDR